MKLTPGELYFAGEEDPLDGRLTPLVKIGIVREREGRTSEDRLAEHQTGNPRRLQLLRVLPSLAIDRVETLLHTEFAPRRIGGEWFHLPSDDLTVVMDHAAIHIDEAATTGPTLEAAQRLEATRSNGQVLTPDTATLELHRRLLVVRKHLSMAKEAEKLLEAALLEAREDAVDEYPYVTEQFRAPRHTFDKDAFTAAHPRLAARYTIERDTLNRRFRLSGLQSHVLDVLEDNPALGRHLADIRESVNDGNAASMLHRQFLELLALRGPLDWEKELLEARLQAACQEYEKIAGVCTWTRTPVTTLALDTTTLKAERPDLHTRFLQEGRSTRAVSISRHLGYRLPESSH